MRVRVGLVQQPRRASAPPTFSRRRRRPARAKAHDAVGGWSRAVDELVDNGYARFEFKSAGTGNLARFLNGGKPFTDDLEFAVEESGVCVRSSSRVGDSDFGVNKARLAFISAELKRLGWDAKGPSA